jgi:hypothetical protein
VPLQVDPVKIEINNYIFEKISVVKLTLHNEYKMPRKFMIVPPKRSSNFSIQCKDKLVGSKDSVEVFIWFNPQKEKEII